jgi:hypothetical protein
MTNGGYRSRGASCTPPVAPAFSDRISITNDRIPQIFNHHFPAFQPEKSDRSGSPVKADGHISAFNDHRNFSGAFGELQHAVEMSRVFYDVKVFEWPSVFGKCFTSCPGIRSSVFSINHNFISHDFLSHLGQAGTIFPSCKNPNSPYLSCQHF